ncbi:hypothetical protein ACS0TY_036643 [Phlomoides rotata]
MESSLYLVILVLVPLLFFLTKNTSSKRLPPGSLGLPVIGQTLQLLKAMRNDRGEEWLQERSRKYGPISKLHVFGTPTVFLVGQATNKFIYTSDENTLSSKQPTTIRRLLGERNMLELNGQDHARLRVAFLSFLKPEALKQSIAKMDEEIRLHLNQNWHYNQEIKVMPLMRTLTFNVICSVLFGIERGARREKLVLLFEQVMDGLLVAPLNLPFTRFNRSLRARSKATKIIRELIHEKREKQRKQGIPNHQDFITSLLSMRDETDSPLLSDEEIVDNCVVTMLAGHDTTSILLTYMIKLLSENPQVYDTVHIEQEEIAQEKASGEHLTWEDLAKMKYTWRVATEVLRMYPPMFFNTRQVLKDIEIGGYIIPKGWQVLWAGCMTHMDESTFPDPNKFNPSRYEKLGAIPAHTFVAFGGGPRMCPGNEFARIETLTMMHYLVTGFKWKLCFEENVMSRDPLPVFKLGLPILIEKSTSF